jgi:hypothetical protein
MSLFTNDGATNQAPLTAETPFISVVIRPRSKLLKNERKALEVLSGGLVLIDDVCPDNAEARGFSAFDDLTIKWVLRSADWVVLCPTDDPLVMQFIPEPIRAAAIGGYKVVVITTPDDQFTNWLAHVRKWCSPDVEVGVDLFFPGSER